MEVDNGIIRQAEITREDHGIPTICLTVDCGCGVQGLGNYDMRYKQAMCNWLMGLMDTLGVTEWSQMVGRHCRVEREDGLITRIGHIIEDKWFDPRAASECADDAGLAATKGD